MPLAMSVALAKPLCEEIFTKASMSPMIVPSRPRSGVVKPMVEGVGWGLSAAGLSLAMLAFSHKEGFELLSLSGGRRVLIEWPDYPLLKMRIVIAFVWCLLGAFACFIATWMVAKNLQPLLGITLMISGLLSAAGATATIALARFSLRELLQE